MGLSHAPSELRAARAARASAPPARALCPRCRSARSSHLHIESVLAGLVPVIHASMAGPQIVDARLTAGHDGHLLSGSTLQHLPDLLGGLGKYGLIFHLARVRLHRHASPDRYDVKMQVEHGLARGLAVELLDQDAVGADRLLD